MGGACASSRLQYSARRLGRAHKSAIATGQTSRWRLGRHCPGGHWAGRCCMGWYERSHSWDRATPNSRARLHMLPSVIGGGFLTMSYSHAPAQMQRVAAAAVVADGIILLHPRTLTAAAGDQRELLRRLQAGEQVAAAAATPLGGVNRRPQLQLLEPAAGVGRRPTKPRLQQSLVGAGVQLKHPRIAAAWQQLAPGTLHRSQRSSNLVAGSNRIRVLRVCWAPPAMSQLTRQN